MKSQGQEYAGNWDGYSRQEEQGEDGLGWLMKQMEGIENWIDRIGSHTESVIYIIAILF